MGDGAHTFDLDDYLDKSFGLYSLEDGNPFFTLRRLKWTWVTKSTFKYIMYFVVLFAVVLFIAYNEMKSFDYIDDYTLFIIVLALLAPIPAVAFLVIYGKEGRREGHWRAFAVDIDRMTDAIASRLSFEGKRSELVSIKTKYTDAEDARALVLEREMVPVFIALFRLKGLTIVHIGMLTRRNREVLVSLRSMVDDVCRSIE
jgi:hypothetical protein